MKPLLPAVLRTFFILLSPLLAFSAWAQQSEPIDSIIAIVNDQIILRSELESALHNVLTQYAGHTNELPPKDILERQLLDRLIMTKLQVERAKNNGITVTDNELNSAMQSIAEQNHTNLDGLRQRVLHDGISYSELRQSIREEIMVQRLRQNFAMSRVNVSESEIDAALAQQTPQETQYRLAHILISLPQGATAEQIAQAQKKAEEVKHLLDQGKLDFAAAAARYSNSPNALDGGDLGWRSPTEVPNAFISIVEKMQPGQIIGPIQGPSGFQILQLTDKRTASTASNENSVRQFHAKHILIRVNDTESAKAAKEKIDSIEKQLDQGASFAELAKKYSEDDTSRNQDGDLGWFAEDTYGPEFGKHVAALSDGQRSRPFQTEAGWHIVERIASRMHAPGQNERREAMRAMIGRRKLEDDYAHFLQELRGEAYIKILLPGINAAQSTPATSPNLTPASSN